MSEVENFEYPSWPEVGYVIDETTDEDGAWFKWSNDNGQYWHQYNNMAQYEHAAMSQMIVMVGSKVYLCEDYE